MKKKLSTLLATVCSFLLYAQVGVNTTSPKATLDIEAKNAGTASEGFIPPRLTGNELSTAETNGVYTSAQNGTIVYVTTPAATPGTGQTQYVTAAGYYYFDSGKWQKFIKPRTASRTALSNTDITVEPTDEAIVFSGNQLIKITFPAPTAIDDGRVVYVYNDSSAASGNADLIGTTTGVSTQLNYGRGKFFVCANGKWLTIF